MNENCEHTGFGGISAATLGREMKKIGFISTKITRYEGVGISDHNPNAPKRNLLDQKFFS